MLLTANVRRTLLSASTRSRRGLPILNTASRAQLLQQRNMTASNGVIKTLEQHERSKRFWGRMAALGLGMGVLQYTLGEADNLFEHKFITRKKPEDLADFYGSEDFMELFCVFPFMVHLMMRNAEFQDDGTILAFGLGGPGELEISIEFSEEEIDTTGDGEPDTMSWFNKKETFQDFAPDFLGGFKLWEMTQNFGYHWRADGTSEVYHQGEKFSGFFPVRLIFAAHSRYVIWATEKYINSDAFGAEDREDDLEVQRQNIPLHVFKQFVEGLTVELEKAKDAPNKTIEQQREIDVTIRRLKTIADTSTEESGVELKSRGTRKPVTLARMRTLRSHNTNRVNKVILSIDDKETKDTIKTAMEQIGSTSGKKHEPAKELTKLARHATIVAYQTQNQKRKPSS